MLKTEKNPQGLPMAVFDEIRKNTAENRAQFFKDFALPFYGYNRTGAKVSEGVCDSFWHQGMMGGIKGIHDCIAQFAEVDFTEDLKKIDVPALIVHGDDDQVVPIADSAMISSKLIPNAELKVYPNAPHGFPVTHQDQFNADLLAFIQAKEARSKKVA